MENSQVLSIAVQLCDLNSDSCHALDILKYSNNVNWGFPNVYDMYYKINHSSFYSLPYFLKIFSNSIIIEKPREKYAWTNTFCYFYLHSLYSNVTQI